jgi:hypothetical protein
MDAPGVLLALGSSPQTPPGTPKRIHTILAEAHSRLLDSLNTILCDGWGICKRCVSAQPVPCHPAAPACAATAGEGLPCRGVQACPAGGWPGEEIPRKIGIPPNWQLISNLRALYNDIAKKVQFILFESTVIRANHTLLKPGAWLHSCPCSEPTLFFCPWRYRLI